MLEAQKDLLRPEFGSHRWRWSIRLAEARARLELARGNLAAAAESIDSLLEQAERMEARKYLARGMGLRGQLHVAEQATQSAQADFQSALQLAEAICYLPMRVEARRCLSRLYQHTGAADLAKQVEGELSSLLAALDAQLQHPELRQNFERGIRKLK